MAFTKKQQEKLEKVITEAVRKGVREAFAEAPKTATVQRTHPPRDELQEFRENFKAFHGRYPRGIELFAAL